MTDISVPTDFDVEVERNYKHNFMVNFFDGTFFWAGMSFITSSTILPLYISHFTDSKFLIGLIPAIGSGGWLLPQLFTANLIQQLPRKKVVPVIWGMFSERLPIFLLALTALWFADNSPVLALITFYLFYSWHTIGAGVIAVGWQDMIAKVIPRDRIGRFFGVTNFTGTMTGMFGALAAGWVLDHYDFPTGYIVSFFAAAIFMLISWSFLAQTREPEQVSDKAPISQREFFRHLPEIIRGDRNFAHYLISRVTITLGGMAGGFVAVYAVERWDLPDSQAGYFTTAILIGQAFFYLIYGQLADRKGHKLVLELSALSSASAIGISIVANRPEWFYLVFGLTGGAISGYILSGIAIAFEFSSPDIRPTYIGLNNTINGIASIIAPLLGATLANAFGFRGLFIVASMIGALGFVLMRWWVSEPRDQPDKPVSLS